MLVAEAREPRNQPARRERGRRADRDVCAALREPVRRVADQVQRTTHVGEIGEPVGRQREAARQAFEQRHAERVLQMADLLRDRALGDADLVGRRAEVQVPRGHLERAERIQRRQAAGLSGGHVEAGQIVDLAETE